MYKITSPITLKASCSFADHSVRQTICVWSTIDKYMYIYTHKALKATAARHKKWQISYMYIDACKKLTLPRFLGAWLIAVTLGQPLENYCTPKSFTNTLLHFFFLTCRYHFYHLQTNIWKIDVMGTCIVHIIPLFCTVLVHAYIYIYIHKSKHRYGKLDNVKYMYM